MSDPVLTFDEVAARLGVSRRTVEREVKCGRLRAIGVGPGRRLRRVTERELAAYLAAAHRAA